MTVAALRWTRTGAVATPETLHLRIEPEFPGRVAAGAPLPSRALTDDEIVDNVRSFVDPGPRGRPVRAVVLSGVTRARLDTLPGVVARVRALGIPRVVVHLPVGLARDVPGVDEIAVAVRDPDEARSAVGLVASVPLERPVLDRLPPVLEALRGARRVTLLWPLPGSDDPPAAGRVVAALRAAHQALEALPWGIKGLPPCALVDLPGAASRVWRSANRWYVDADHQGQAALLWRPDLVRFDKRDTCRFCAVDARCDGVPEPWLRRGLAGPVAPLAEEPS